MNRHLCKGIGAVLGMIIVILDSKTALLGASDGIDLCIKTVIPSLFPFFVLSNILINALSGFDSYLLRKMSSIFHIPPGAEGLTICSFLGGYPVGAQSIGNLYLAKIISRKDAEELLAYCSNAGPAFIFGMISCLFQSKKVPWILWMIHIASAFLISRRFSDRKAVTGQYSVNHMSMTAAITSAIKTMGQVCAWVILFRMVICFLNRWVLWLFPIPVQILLSGFLEMTNGCIALKELADEKVRFIICSALLSFGGLCVGMQTRAVTQGLSLKYYFYGKAAQTIISAILSATIVYQKWTVLLILFVLFIAIPQFYQNKGSIPKMIRV